MNIEKGEYFVVTRGFAFNMSAISVFDDPITAASRPEPKQQYDRSHEGKIFKAIEVCGPMICAECVHADGYKREYIGQRYSLNTTEVEVWPVTSEYTEQLVQSARAANKEPC